tara:strand:+ start:492 stop:794 length:303 start_codon:yes stop_codon:yes gene_type:complete
MPHKKGHKKNYNSYSFRNQSVDRITGPTRTEKIAKRDSIMKVAKKNIQKRHGNYGNVRPDVVIREAKRITMEDRIKNTPAGQRFARRANPRLTRKKRINN